MPRSAVVGPLGALVLLALPDAAPAAEAVKLRPLAAIYVAADEGGLREPEGVGCRGGTVVVADTANGRILTFAIVAGTVQARDAFSILQVPVPRRVELLAGGDILVLDGRSRRIARITSAGAFASFLDPSGGVPDRVEPRSFAVGPDDRVFVLDVAGWRVLVTDLTGAVERSIAIPADAGFPSDVTVDDRGDVYVVDSVARRVYAARAGEPALAPLTPTLDEDLDFPTSIEVDAEGRVFVVDQHGGGIVILGRDGSFRGRQLSMGWKPGFVRYPSDICIDERGLLSLAERGNSRVQTFEIR